VTAFYVFTVTRQNAAGLPSRRCQAIAAAVSFKTQNLNTRR
jgi:hypothetical protein